MTYTEAKAEAKKAAVDLLFAAIVHYKRSEIVDGYVIKLALQAAQAEGVTLEDIETRLRGAS